MKWVDDAKKKAQSVMDDAKRKATDAAADATAKAREEAGKAAARAAWNEVERRVTGFADKLLGSAEAELAERQAAHDKRTSAEGSALLPDDDSDNGDNGDNGDDAPLADPDDAIAEPEPEPEGPTAAEREAAALEELRRLKAEAGLPAPEIAPEIPATPAIQSAPEPHPIPEAHPTPEIEAAPDPAPVLLPDPTPVDPMDAATAALRAAAAARGVAYEPAPEPDPTPLGLPDPTPAAPVDPMQAAQALLERSAAARAMATKGSRAAAREAAAREELERLKAGLGGSEADDPAAPSSGSRKRDL